MQSRYYDPELGRFINADAYASTGQGVLGNNMFAYCLNNPVVLADNSGNAAHICFGYDGQRDESPWRIGSPGGGGWLRSIHYSRQDYGSVTDKFYTVRALKYANRKILSCYQEWIDSYCEYTAINAELEYNRFTAVKIFCGSVVSSSENTMDFLSITRDNIGVFALCAKTAEALSFGVVGGIVVAMIFAGYSTFSYIYSIYES